MDPPGVSRKRQGPSPPDTHRKRYQSYPAPGADIIDLCGDDSSPPAPKAPQISSRFPQRPHYVSAPWSGTQGNPFLIDADEYALDESGHVEEVTNRSHSLGMATAVLSFPGCDQSAVDGMQAAQGLARQAVYSRPLPLSSPFEVPYRSTMQTNLVQSAPDVVPLTEPILCKEQADLVELILSGANVFYTGSAGCGKSTVLKAFVRRFKERGMRVDIVAPTGRAALDINGSTTWTYAGWTPDAHKKPLKKLKEAAHGKKPPFRTPQRAHEGGSGQ
ncbi:hypothetical protein P154DRAFT_192937 [Amniculicola lignicola CBS 123094]|uniref:ATP-dependent DNA helicase n=1 Tax=Amniculicola lignicola CBS 123094 TaxID=1392246 RepID=A0A6A5WGW9_9PLEO|nr:hypothetical protein P154DRAFT_192937 [Amniculicola lignicola CBS 123094]